MEMTAKQEKAARQTVNGVFASMNPYHNGLPLEQMNETLTSAGFNELEPAVYCGRDGHVHEQVGERTWFSMTWYQMEVTGRYEVVAYLS